MLEFISNYGLFLAKSATVVISLLIVFGFVFALAHRDKSEEGKILITDISSELESIQNSFQKETLTKKSYKAMQKEKKHDAKTHKKKAKKSTLPPEKDRLFVIRFESDIRASGLEEFREIITAILSCTTDKDEVMVVLESGGGFVHSYGLAASQLQRIKAQGISLTVCIDKIAASGGYLMASVANRILAAPFAIVGSIGVVAQIPNFHKLLGKHHIDIEHHTAGEFKRTLTVLGKNTDKGRKKFQEEMEITHTLFKNFLSENRPVLDLEKVATGEHWHASKAMEFDLVDKIQTSDDYILEQNKTKKVFEISYQKKKSIVDKFQSAVQNGIQNGLSMMIEQFEKLAFKKT